MHRKGRNKITKEVHLSFGITLNSNVKVLLNDYNTQSMVSYFGLHAMNAGIL